MAFEEIDEDDPDPLGPARPLLVIAVRLASRAASTGDLLGSYILSACAARLARKVRGLGEVADFRLERALDEAENEPDPTSQADAIRNGLESLLGDIEPEPEAPATDSLATAQKFIAMAISIGAPAYNTGDRQGCYDVYATTARMVLATLPDLPAEPIAKLHEGLDRASGLDDPDEQVWAMRHVFDAVGEMGPGADGVASREVRMVLTMAISIGAPAFSLGDHRGCYEVYACTARLLVNSAGVPDGIKQPLRQALERASVLPSVTRQAAVMREVFEALLTGSSAAPDRPAS